MRTLPTSVRAYNRTAEFTENTVPEALLNEHQTKDGVWGVIKVISGQLQYNIPATGEEIVLGPALEGIVEPAVDHRVKPLGPVRFYIEFWR